jgi:hypothetical protein
MHLFLYQAARHKATTSVWGGTRYRYKQGTIRGDFDLELLKRGIKGRFKILPHGEHEFQQALKKVGLEHEFYGHIVQIEEARNAIWFKLNYDQVGKNITKYIGGWRDLEPSAIEAEIMEYEVLMNYQKSMQDQFNQVSYMRSSTNSFADRASRGNRHPMLDNIFQETLLFKDKVDATLKTLEEERLRTTAKITEVQDRVKAYLKERKL